MIRFAVVTIALSAAEAWGLFSLVKSKAGRVLVSALCAGVAVYLIGEFAGVFPHINGYVPWATRAASPV